jgi:hypothetical protein
MLRELEDRAHTSEEKMTRVSDPAYDALFQRLEEICAKRVSHASEAVIAYGLQEIMATYGNMQVRLLDCTWHISFISMTFVSFILSMVFDLHVFTAIT